MTAALLVAALALQAPTVDVMVAGKERVLHTGEVRMKPRAVKVSGRRCRVGARTPLSALAGTGLRLKLRDYGRCSRRPRDASGLYVRGVRREVERGRAGWVYKVGRRAGTLGAGDPGIRRGRRVTWFWCVRAGDCQRTLEARPDRTSLAPGEPLTVTVRGYDDLGRGAPVEGATVRLGTATAVTGADGRATLVATESGRLEAERDGMVPAFPREVRVG
jgi:hypothetical protein